MFAFLRVIVFYVGFGALLIWGMFAFGWAETLELPGFEGPRVTVATAPPAVRFPQSNVPATPAQPAAAPPEIMPEPRRVVMETPPPPAPKVADPVAPPPARVEVAVAASVPEPPRTVEPPKAAPPAPAPPSPPSPPPAAAAPPPLPPPRTVDAPPPAAAPPTPPSPPPAAAAPRSPPPPRIVEAAPAKPAPAAVPTWPPQVRAPAPVEAAARPWAPGYRIAGFGPDALVDLLGETRRARDDIACVMFRNIVFKAGTTVYQPRARAELELVARVLMENPGQRVELGSRLGPGRPMATDPKLRTDRASLLRDNLIALGVPAARLAIDTGEAYERVAEDVGRINGGRVQSMGVCVYAP